jgi:TfoX/Sxy family transcriptional regulator of competence genes
MAYDEGLAGRVRRILGGRGDFAEKKMFGGLAFMIEGHMGCGVIGADLMVRVGPEGLEEALARPHARLMDFTGRPSKGMVYVGPAGLRTEKALEAWVGRALALVQTLPGRKSKGAMDKARGQPQRRRVRRP